ncbi:hypothetical protein F5X99DRAFT_431491 [Biscogniauxia marginata]|nr:hypothetical protein F5X99DRAFT_431491 [Biscogniauxia marginata]
MSEGKPDTCSTVVESQPKLDKSITVDGTSTRSGLPIRIHVESRYELKWLTIGDTFIEGCLKNTQLRDLLKGLKKKIACCGYIKDENKQVIRLFGDQRLRVEAYLLGAAHGFGLTAKDIFQVKNEDWPYGYAQKSVSWNFWGADDQQVDETYVIKGKRFCKTRLRSVREIPSSVAMTEGGEEWPISEASCRMWNNTMNSNYINPKTSWQKSWNGWEPKLEASLMDDDLEELSDLEESGELDVLEPDEA